MKILAIETSTRACSAALSLGQQITEKHEILNNQHSEFLLSFIDDLLMDSSISKSELDMIAVGNGPGSFTGLRLGMGVAQGLSYGLGKPLIPVSSLLTIAAQANLKYLLVAVDARMGEVYWQCFKRHDELNYTELTMPNLSKPSALLLPKIDGEWHGMGSGFDVYSEQLEAYLSNGGDYTADLLPKASLVAKFAHRLAEKGGGVDSVQHVLPAYIREQVTG